MPANETHPTTESPSSATIVRRVGTGPPSGILPHAGQVTLAEVLAVLRAAPETLDSGNHIDLRVVAIPRSEQGTWTIFAGEVRLCRDPGRRTTPELISAGAIRLVWCRAPVDSLTTERDFWRFARSWHAAISSHADTAEPQTTSAIERVGSGRPFGEAPGWRFTLYALAVGDPFILMPPAPFFSREHNFFAATVGDAAAKWLEQPDLQQLKVPQGFLSVVIPDRRAYFGDLKLKSRTIDITVLGFLPPEGLTVAALFTDADGREGEHVVQSPGRSLALKRPSGELRRLELYILAENGERLDDFYEDEFRCTRARSVLAASPRLHGSIALERALALGEGETIEFKEFIPTERGEAKSKELLEVVSAFGNTRGGQLFIGIDDHLEVVGLARHLRVRARGNLARARADYARAIRRLIREGITPEVGFELQWLKMAGIDVLQVRVSGRRPRGHALRESGEIFVRRGASCTKARPEDLRLIFGRTPDMFPPGRRSR